MPKKQDIAQELEDLNACDDRCQGRCSKCPNDTIREAVAEIKRLRAVEALAQEWATAYSGNDHLRLGDAEIMLHGGVSSYAPNEEKP